MAFRPISPVLLLADGLQRCVFTLWQRFQQIVRAYRRHHAPGKGIFNMWFLILPITCISHGRQSNLSVSTSSPLISCIGVAFQLLIDPFACFGHRLNAKRRQCLVIITGHRPSLHALHTRHRSAARHSGDKTRALYGCRRSPGS